MNTSRVPQRAMDVFGLFAIIESKRVVLPLKGVECDFSVLSGLVEVSMIQIFRQENDRALDCEYLFPLPADAAVFFCEADINGRVIRAQVRERGEARKIAAEKKAAGFRTSLVESERDNLFTLSLGNVQPGDLVIIRLKYFQTLRSLGDTRSVQIPFCPGVRYIPGKALLRSNRGKGIVDDTGEVPDASKITPVRIDANHPDAAFVDVRGTLDGKFVAAGSLSSPSHPVAIHPVGNELRVTLEDKGDVPDRDFVLRWKELDAEAVAPRVWIQQDGSEEYALMEVRAPKKASSERPSMDFYFLVDRSGSMQGEKWNKAVEALQSCVRVLGPADRAMVTFFDTQPQDFAEGPLPVQELLRDRQFQMVQRLGTGGGTEMRLALAHVLEVAVRHSQGRDKNLIVITDAQVGNESAILGLMKNAPDLPVHCFGIDIALNDSLLLALCRQQGGTFHSLHPRDNIQQTVSSLGQTLGCPVLLDLKLSAGWELADAKIPNLYAGQIHYLSARSTNGSPLELTGRTASSASVKIQFEKQAMSREVSQLHWCRSRIERLLAEEDENAAIALSVRSNLICRLTAFIAWDESEKVPVATHHLVQPSADLEIHYSCLMEPSRSRMKKSNAAGGRFLVNGLMQEPDSFREYKMTIISELRLKHELEILCDRIGIADRESLLQPIFNWLAEADDEERSRRFGEVNRLLREIRLFWTEASGEAQELVEGQRKRAEQLLKSFVDKLQKRAPISGSLE